MHGYNTLSSLPKTVLWKVGISYHTHFTYDETKTCSLSNKVKVI